MPAPTEFAVCALCEGETCYSCGCCPDCGAQCTSEICELRESIEFDDNAGSDAGGPWYDEL